MEVMRSSKLMALSTLLIFNDWPSFSPCVNAAAEAISQLILSDYDS